MEQVTIYHNPSCGTSRNVLGLIRNCGIEPEIIEYLIAPPSRAKLMELLTAMKLKPRDLIRAKPDEFEKIQERFRTDDELIAAMADAPHLINRPIVVTSLGVRLCRPSEVVLDILPERQRGEFRKEDGELIVDSQGRRVHKNN